MYFRVYILVCFKSIRVAIFYACLPKPNATLLLYPGLRLAMLNLELISFGFHLKPTPTCLGKKAMLLL